MLDNIPKLGGFGRAKVTCLATATSHCHLCYIMLTGQTKTAKDKICNLLLSVLCTTSSAKPYVLRSDRRPVHVRIDCYSCDFDGRNRTICSSLPAAGLCYVWTNDCVLLAWDVLLCGFVGHSCSGVQ